MDLTELLEAIRQEYVDRLAFALHEAKATPGARLISEAVLRDGDGVPVRDGRLNVPQRVDAVVLADDGAVETVSVDSDKMLAGFADIRFDWPGGLAVALHPLCWDALRVHFPTGSAAMDWGPLLTWYDEWFKADEDGTGDLLLAVHAVTDPADDAGGVTVQIDLGSAPVGALEDLLDALAGLDVAEVVLGQPPAG